MNNDVSTIAIKISNYGILNINNINSRTGTGKAATWLLKESFIYTVIGQ